MKDIELRKALARAYEDEPEGECPVLLDDACFDKSIIGVTDDDRVVYDLERMYEEYAEDEGCTLEEATEWVEYNTLRAIPYMGEKRPVVVAVGRDAVLERF